MARQPVNQRFILIACIGLLWLAQVADATIYYVNNSGSPACGNSAGNGTLAQPFCTITYAIAHIASGDTIYARSGTYNEDLYISGPAGSAGSNTVIAAYPGDSVILRGNGVNTGRCKIANTSHITFKGFTITNYNQGLFVESCDSISIQNCTVDSVGQEGMHVRLNSSYITIENCVIHDTRMWQYNGEGIYVGTAATSTPLDNTNHITIRNTTIYNISDEGIELKPGTHDAVIEGCTLYNCLTDPSYASPISGSIEIDEAVNTNQHWDTNPNHVARNNFIHNTKTAIRAGTGSLICNNVIYGITGGFNGVYIDNGSGDSYPRKIYHNTIDVPSAQAVVISGTATTDIRNNIGPATAKNLPTQNSFYANRAGADYHLVNGAAPINVGDNLTTDVSADIDGNSRAAHLPPDLGAYEYTNSSQAYQVNTRVYPRQEFISITATAIIFAITQSGHIYLKVFGASGKCIRTIVEGWAGKGEHCVSWSGQDCSPGLYFFRLDVEGSTLAQKEIIMQ